MAKKNGRKRRLERVTLLLTEHEKKVLGTYAAFHDKSVTAAVRDILRQEIDDFAAKPVK